jgi:hypothetical protein
LFFLLFLPSILVLLFLPFLTGSVIFSSIELLHHWSFLNKQKFLASSSWCPYIKKFIKNLNQPCSN